MSEGRAPRRDRAGQRAGVPVPARPLIVAAVLIATAVLSPGAAASPPTRTSHATTVGTAITSPLAPVGAPRRNPLAEAVGNSWMALNRAAYEKAKASADAAAAANAVAPAVPPASHKPRPTPKPKPSPTPSPTPAPTPTAPPTLPPTLPPTTEPTLPPTLEPTIAPSSPPGGLPTIGASWNGQYQGQLAPPDPTGAIGPSRYIELINLRYGIYDRTGALLANAGSQGDLGALTGLPVSELSDPQILWDPGAQRFYYLVLDINRYGFAFGYSLTPDPSSPADFCKYILNYGYGSTLSLPDYPKMAVTNDFVLIGANVFLFLSFYNGSDLDWLFKPPTDSCPATIGGGRFPQLKNADGSYTSTPVPAVNADPTSTGWVMGSVDASSTPSGTGNVLSAFRVTKASTGAATLTGPFTIPVAPYGVPASARQNGTSATLDTLDSRLEHAMAGIDPRLGGPAVWTAHAVHGGAGSEVRWYEISTAATPALAQSGVVSSASDFVWNGAISSDRANDGAGTAAFGSNMVLGFNTSSTTSYPALQMVSKRGADPQSAMVLVKDSTGPNVDFTCSPCRWGDYAGAKPDPDPAAGGRVWLSGEWNVAATDGSSPVWRTWNWAAGP